MNLSSRFSDKENEGEGNINDPEFGLLKFKAFTASIQKVAPDVLNLGEYSYTDILDLIMEKVLRKEGDLLIDDEEECENGIFSLFGGPYVYTTPVFPIAMLQSLPYGSLLALSSVSEDEGSISEEQGILASHEESTVFVGKVQLGSESCRRTPVLIPLVAAVTKTHPLKGSNAWDETSTPLLTPLDFKFLSPIQPPPELLLLLPASARCIVLASQKGKCEWLLFRMSLEPLEAHCKEAEQDRLLHATLHKELNTVPQHSLLSSDLEVYLEIGRKELFSTWSRYRQLASTPAHQVDYYECDVFVAAPEGKGLELDEGGKPYIEIPRVPFLLVKLEQPAEEGGDWGQGVKAALDLLHSLRVSPGTVKPKGLDIFNNSLDYYAGKDYI